MTHPSNTEVSAPLPHREGVGVSLLIPTYNYVCAHLVCELQKQCEEVQALLGEAFSYEIIVADDGSTDHEAIEKNAVIELLPNCRYIDNDANRGRSAIRNQLVRESHGDWMLIIDNDAEVTADDFILRYWQSTDSGASIIVGGLVTPDQAPAGCELRLRYEQASEGIRDISARTENPAMFFSTFNFMASRSVFDAILFDERCTEYGYEDALFGIEAERKGFTILHIDNPLQHNGINDNATFLRNSETALRTLKRLGPPMTDRARVAQAAFQLQHTAWRRWLLATPIILLYKATRPLLRRNLLSHHPNLSIFTFYKLGYYMTLQDHQTTCDSP